MSVARQEPHHFADFRLSITKALGDQLGEEIRKLTPAPLAPSALSGLKPEPGVYQLYRRDKLVYIGKADRSLPERLAQHGRKISGRENISTSEMTFTCLYVAEDFSAVAPETLLIKQHQGHGQAPWNNNGFGNKDPGRNRDRTVVKSSHFDAHFPINLSTAVSVRRGVHGAKHLLESLKDSLPYNLRYDEVFKAKSGAALERIEVLESPTTAREAFRLIVGSLPAGWQLTALPGYAILYKEAIADVYKSALVRWRRDEYGHVIETAGAHIFSADDGTPPLDTDESYDS
ncbi:Eco29kI family restriction endonuclease [Actinospica durhamensis]|uniref:Eco29kI family restriction endonuclease n=1 Tax=Actinospica durhamensis TaxID=1508375 RepID=A0A941EN11_9ACTN|nr:Eco29kI family restriction endonuclease [Actinospica durhamensis]MBR7833482.1 Eco29kI family restriction endonuclease [Actinospica durhamensis]